MSNLIGGKDSESSTVSQLFIEHDEAIVICLDITSEGESKIEVFTKLLDDNSKLSLFLDSVLENLRSIRNAKSRPGPNYKPVAS